MEDFQFASIVVSTIRNAPVLMFAAMAGLFAERSGVVDIGLEGKILASAFVSAAVAYTYQNPWLGIAAGIVVSVVLALIQAFVCDHPEGQPARGRHRDQHRHERPDVRASPSTSSSRAGARRTSVRRACSTSSCPGTAAGGRRALPGLVLRPA